MAYINKSIHSKQFLLRIQYDINIHNVPLPREKMPASERDKQNGELHEIFGLNKRFSSLHDAIERR